MEENQVKDKKEIESDSFLRKVILIARRNIILILLIIVAFMVGGYVISKIKKPDYTATSKVVMSVPDKGIIDGYDYLSLDIVSVLDFCSTNVVADRADFYYNSYIQELENNPHLSSDEYVKAFGIFEDYNKLSEKPASYEKYMELVITSKNSFKNQEKGYEDYIEYLLQNNIIAEFGEFKYFALNKKNNPSLTVDGYMSQFKTLKTYNAKDYVYTGNVKASLVSTSGYKKEEKYNNQFNMHYVDKNSQNAYDKIIMLVFSANEELSGEVEYFKGVSFNLISNGAPSISANTSTGKIVLIAFLIGIVVSVLVVYLKSILDKTVKDKKTLEELTGVKLISYISKREDK